MNPVQSVTSTVTGTVSDLTSTITSSVGEAINDTVAAVTRRLDLTNLQVPTFDVPKFQLPAFDARTDLPQIDLPQIDLPIDTDRVAGFARDVAYVGVGAAVVVAQETDERVRSLADSVTKTITTSVRQVVGAIR